MKTIVTRSDLVKKMHLEYETSGLMGLCGCYRRACNYLFDVSISPAYLRLLPHFVPPKNRMFEVFWWNPEDRISRFQFLDKLLTLYKDDKTNLVDIVNDWLDCPTWVDKEAFNQKLIESYEKDLSVGKTNDAVV